jgi:L-aminopeptidase/D-esterase-like protein
MTYPSPPTLDDFNTRFPAFGDFDPDQAQACLTEAINTVDNSWRDLDYVPAILYLTAHLLATDNAAAGDDISVGAGTGAIASESFGGMSVSYATSGGNNAAAVESSAYATTSYGRRYYGLLKANKTGPVVV